MQRTYNVHLSIGPQVLEDLAAFCTQSELSHGVIVADANTYRTLGQEVERLLRDRGFDVTVALLQGDEVVADAEHILQLLLQIDRRPQTLIAVGSGTITDITRFVSHRTQNDFLSLPTAPSVDGFASIGAPLIVDGVKTTYITQPPAAIFAHTPTLAAAPPAMIAAGFGDMIAKYTSLADWQLGRLLWNEPYDEAIHQRFLAATNRCVEQAAAIGARSEAGIRTLIETLIESGFCMLDFASSRPASGAEHHYSHFWEMKLLNEGRPAILHGAKVGVATVEIARQYERLLRLSRSELSDLLETATRPDREQEVAAIRAVFGPMAPAIIQEQRPFLDMDDGAFDALKERILTHWSDIQKIASQVPSASALTALLETVGGPVDVAGLGLTDAELTLAEQNGHYLRERFTVRKLMRVLGV
ncbi:MAG: sn-glycerol-1-phosphate dehydrogenase [Caldilineaceae bacterium]|nr:sn-glycerol-1-phosphate dehydrogenase [Caldilineaceae bacterium]